MTTNVDSRTRLALTEPGWTDEVKPQDSLLADTDPPRPNTNPTTRRTEMSSTKVARKPGAGTGPAHRWMIPRASITGPAATTHHKAPRTSDKQPHMKARMATAASCPRGSAAAPATSLGQLFLPRRLMPAAVRRPGSQDADHDGLHLEADPALPKESPGHGR
jgi:hypothetical protein